MRGYISINQDIKLSIHHFIAFSTIIKSVGIYIMTIQEAKQIRIANYRQGSANAFPTSPYTTVGTRI